MSEYVKYSHFDDPELYSGRGHFAPSNEEQENAAEIKALREFNDKCKVEKDAEISKLRDVYNRGELKAKIPGSSETIVVLPINDCSSLELFFQRNQSVHRDESEITEEDCVSSKIMDIGQELRKPAEIPAERPMTTYTVQRYWSDQNFVPTLACDKGYEKYKRRRYRQLVKSLKKEKKEKRMAKAAKMLEKLNLETKEKDVKGQNEEVESTMDDVN